MIRIIAGDFKGRKLKTPKGTETRPSPARLREALFDVLGESVTGGAFYDLFAGSGAVGFEALSRGAPRVIFVEEARAAVACLRENIAALGCGERAECVTRRLPAWLESPDFDPQPPAIFFLDPPFRQNLSDAVLEALGRVLPALRTEWAEACTLNFSAIPNPQSKICNPKSEIRNPKSEIRNPKPAAPLESAWLESICAAQTEKGAVLRERYGSWRLRKRYPHGDSALWVYEIG